MRAALPMAGLTIERQVRGACTRGGLRGGRLSPDLIAARDAHASPYLPSDALSNNLAEKCLSSSLLCSPLYQFGSQPPNLLAHRFAAYSEAVLPGRDGPRRGAGRGA
jgi:hypothetical protein